MNTMIDINKLTPIQPEEIRKGNWIEFWNGDEFIGYKQILGINTWENNGLGNRAYFVGGGSCPLQQTYHNRPIKLTPKIIEACGFYKGSHKMYMLNHIYKIKYTNTKIMTNCVGFYKNAGRIYTFISALNYLHQLQNLYYSLTKTELIFQP